MVPSTIAPQNPALAISPAFPAPIKLTCCQRICNIIKRVFQAFLNLFRRKPELITLSMEEKQCLATFKKFKTLPKYLPRIQKQPSITSTQNLQILLTNGADDSTNEPDMNVTRQHFVTFAQDLASIITKIIYEKKIQTSLQGVQAHSNQNIQTLRSCINLIAPVLGKGSKITARLMEHRFPIALSPSLQKTLSSLLNNKTRAHIEKAALKHLQANTQLPSGQTLDEYITPILNWLMLFQQCPGGNQAAFTSLFDDPKFDEEVINQTSDTIFKILVEEKIEEGIEKIQKTANSKIPDLVLAMLLANSEKIATILANRVIDLLEQVNFPELIEKMFEIFNAQVLGHVAAVDVAPTIIEKAKQLMKNPSSVSSAVAAELAPIIADIQNCGEEATAQKILLTQFSQHKICHKRISTIVASSKHQAIGTSQFNQNLKKTFYPELANTLISLLFPEEKVEYSNGKTQYIDGMTIIWQQLILSDEFKKLMEGLSEIGNEILEPEIVNAIKGLQHPVSKAIENYAITEAKSFLRPFLSSVLQKQIKNVTQPSRLNELAAFSVFPAVSELLFTAFISTTINAKATVLGPMFFSRLDPATNQKDVVRHIKAKVVEMIPDQLMSSTMKDANITPQFIEHALDPLIEKIHEFFLYAQVQFKTLNKTFHKDQSAETLLQYFNLDPHKQDKTLDLCSTLFENLACKIGKFGNKAQPGTLSGFFKKLLSATLPIFDSSRRSHEMLVKGYSDAFRRNYLNKSSLEKILFGKPTPAPTPAIVDTKLILNIGHVATILFDLISRSAEQTRGLSSILTPLIRTPHVLDELITVIYKKCFSNPILNYNLIFQVHDTVTIILNTIAQDLKEKQALNPRKVSVIP